MTVQSAAPSVRAPPEITQESQFRNQSHNVGSRENSSLMHASNADFRKSNFASGANDLRSVSEDSVSSSMSHTFDYSKHVLENKAVLKKYDSSNNPDSSKLFDRTTPIIHPRVRKIELEEKLRQRPVLKPTEERKNQPESVQTSEVQSPLKDRNFTPNFRLATEKSIKLEVTGMFIFFVNTFCFRQ